MKSKKDPIVLLKEWILKKRDDWEEEDLSLELVEEILEKIDDLLP